MSFQLLRTWLARNIFVLSAVTLLVLSIFLRIAGLTTNPPGLYWEEVALGYDAYSLRLTGRDHHGNLPNLVALESYGDWKPPFYAYLQIPFQWLLGLSAWSVRLPAALSGIWLIFGIVRLAKHLLPTRSVAERKFLLLSTWLVAGTMPWLIVFSRAGWETLVATALIVWGIAHFVEVWQPNKTLSWCSAVLAAIYLGLAAYTYHGARFFAPSLIFLTSLSLISREHLRSWKKYWLSLSLFGLVLALIALPLVLTWRSPMVAQRLQESSVIAGLGMAQTVSVIFRNMMSNFTLQQLFLSGDHITLYSGVMLLGSAPIFLLGLLNLGRLAKRKLFFIVGWIAISVFPAAISGNYPHGVRTLIMAPMLVVILTWGLLALRNFIKHYTRLTQLSVWTLVLVIFCPNTYAFWYDYNFNHRITVAGAWQYGYQAAVTDLTKLQTLNPELPVKISRDYGRPLMFYWFYAQIDPIRVQRAAPTAARDQGELLEFENISIFNQNQLDTLPTSLVMLHPNDYSQVVDRVSLSSTILGLDQKPVWYIGKYQAP